MWGTILKMDLTPTEMSLEEFENFYIKYSFEQLEFLKNSYIKESKYWKRFNNLILKKSSESLMESEQNKTKTKNG